MKIKRRFYSYDVFGQTRLLSPITNIGITRALDLIESENNPDFFITKPTVQNKEGGVSDKEIQSRSIKQIIDKQVREDLFGR